jgi:outer membrane protein assembly factor BamD (BamD/ComL family)
MKSCGRAFFLALIVLVSSPAWGQKKTWEYENGQWPQVEQGPVQSVSDPTIDRAEQYLSHGETKVARQVLFQWEHVHKDSPVRDRAVFLIAQSYYDEDDRILAFYYLDEVMDEYPESRLFYPALEKQYEIADAFLSGRKRRFLGMAILPADEEAVEMMYRIQQRSPGSALAEKSMLRTADYYYADRQYDYAADAYAYFVRNYPRSPQVPRSRLREAFSLLAQFHDVKFDPTPIIDARAQILDIENSYPKMAEDENLPVVVQQIDSAFAQKLLVTGDYFQRTGWLQATVYYYQFLIDTYPASPEASEARQRLARMPAWAFSGPHPPPATGFAPTTEPSGS